MLAKLKIQKCYLLNGADVEIFSSWNDFDDDIMRLLKKSNKNISGSIRLRYHCMNHEQSSNVMIEHYIEIYSMNMHEADLILINDMLKDEYIRKQSIEFCKTSHIFRLTKVNPNLVWANNS